MLARLQTAGIDFVLVGGYAAVAHGVSLVTQDIDICCRFSAENLYRLQNTLTDLHPRHRMLPQNLPLALTDELCSRVKNLYLETDLCVLDCLSEVAGVGGFDEVLAQSVAMATPAGTIRVLDIDTLIRAKETMGRLHDQLTVTQLRAIKERSGF
jgi:hypothetical protein